MPTTIPYDPSLAIGNIVAPAKLANLMAIADLQGPINAAQDEMNSFISLKRSLDMTIQELINMNVDVGELVKESRAVGGSIEHAAVAYAKTRIEQETKLQPLKAKIKEISESLESPIDYVRSGLKPLPLSTDSLKLDAQYFSFDQNEQRSASTVSAIKDFVTASTSDVGFDASISIASSAASQVNQQRSKHSIAGTLVITCTCTHKQAQVFAPFILDPDKGIRVWNKIFTSPEELIKVDDPASLARIAKEEGRPGEKALYLLSGATFGSSFVGMVHVLRTEDTTSDQKMESVASSLQAQINENLVFTKFAGGFGLDASSAKDIKNLVSSQNVTSHVSLITMGIIPTLKSNQVQLAVKGFTDEAFSPDKIMGSLAALDSATVADKTSVAQSADAARTGGQMVTMQGAAIQNTLAAVGKIDDGANGMLDINSMMTAFEDFVAKAIAGNCGVPINYYLKPITRAQLAQMWVAKYYPKKFLAIVGDDSAKAGGANAEPSGEAPPAGQ